ncbi:MAG: AMP-binding protein [Eubacterium sp.]|jgi:fatty-acyl-CoA synthase|nr:AMP-binding protein [Eubacterium sp.]
MKISFSTLACPNFSWTDIYSMAKDLGFDGIEIRGLGEDIFAVKAQPFTESKIKETIDTLKRLGLDIPCVSAQSCLKFKNKLDENISEIKEYINLAKKLRTPYIRVLGDLEPHPVGEVDDNDVKEALLRIIPFAETAKVTILVETNGVYADTDRLKNLLDSIDSEYVGALWDMHHPYRYFGESGKQTVENLGKYIKYIHVKDSVIEYGKPRYRMMGEGDLPIKDFFDALTSIGYNEYISLEWVKRWAGELEDAGIVFPHFVRYMKPFLLKKPHLYLDDRGTGYYPWPKETLINETFPDVLDRICNEFPNQYAFRYTELDYTRTYPEFRHDVDNFAAALISMGVKKGDHVSIWATNVPQWFITFWAATKIGAVLVTVNTAYKIHEAEYLLHQSDTHTLVMIESCKDSNYAEIIKELCPELKNSKPGELRANKLPRLRNIVTVGFSLDGCYTWEQAEVMGKNTDKELVAKMRAEIDKHDVCNMQYTSGTTGFPKGVMLTHYNVVNNGKVIGDCMDFSNHDHLMIQVPMFHCFGMVLAMTASMTHGVTMTPIPIFSPKKGLAAINKEKTISAFHGVPTMFIAMLEHEDFLSTDFSNIRTGIMAGSPCPVKVMEDVLNRMNMRDICITYGQTESSPAITMSKTTDSTETRVSTVGGKVFGVDVKIIDPETGKTLLPEQDGELCARGYNIMRGYYKMDEATKAAIDGDGWLHTGDLARETVDGNYKITGRIKDMIIRGGENIYPKEIEEFLYTCEMVKDVQVIGVPDKQYGEEIMACIVLKSGVNCTEEEIKDLVRANMAKHKVPKYVSFVDGFPMNAAGKILKYKMREKAVEQLGLQADNNIVTA